ncbi:MAG: DUF5995 family protein [Candidatus Thermoplasmatota archaeon]|nr:DUF5995 family protein [Candidatus Thermoplasmatota archaeon]
MVCVSGAGGASTAYVYLPDVLVVQADEDLDAWLDAAWAERVDGSTTAFTLQADLGVQPSDWPEPGDKQSLKRVDKLIKVMGHHWKKLDKQCDPDAVFALMYLLTTMAVYHHTAGEYFDDNDYLADITVTFATLYFDAYDAWHEGDPADAPLPWQEAFAWAESGESSITEDQFLGMNAHIHYDLGVSIAAHGTHDPETGEWRKPDMDRINHVLAWVADDVQWWIAYYYGPDAPEGEPPAWGNDVRDEDWAVLEPITAWREQAWVNGETIEATSDMDDRGAYDTWMQEHSWTVAQGFQSPKTEPTAPARTSYCQAHG